MSNYTHLYAGGESARAACGGRMTKSAPCKPTCPKCKKTYLARKKWSRKQLLKDIDKNLSDKALSMLHRAVYLAEQKKRLIVNAHTNQNGKTGLDDAGLPPNTEFVFFSLYEAKQ